MHTHVTVIPADGYISVDGEGLMLPLTTAGNIHAIQWHNGSGHIEYTDGTPNHILTEADYATVVAFYATLWQTEKDRLDAEANRPPTLAEARDDALDRLAAKTRDTILSGFDHELRPGEKYHFGYDEEDQGNFAKANSAALLALMMQDSGYTQVWRGWQGETPHVFQLTAEEYLGLSRAGADHQLWWQQRHWEKEAAIKAASSLEELNRIII